MNRKVSVIVIALMVAVLLVTPLVGTVMAEKTTTVIMKIPGVDPPTKQEIEMILGDKDKLSGSGNGAIYLDFAFGTSIENNTLFNITTTNPTSAAMFVYRELDVVNTNITNVTQAFGFTSPSDNAKIINATITDAINSSYMTILWRNLVLCKYFSKLDQ